MKNYISIILVLLICSINIKAFAQSDLKFGFRTGFNFSSASIENLPPDVRGNTVYDLSNWIGVVAEGSIEWGFHEYFAVRVDPRFIQKGTQVNYLVRTGYNILTTRLSYLEFPILFKAAYPGKVISPFITFGPSIGFLLDTKVQYKEENQTTEPELEDAFKPMEFGVFVGAGVMYNIAESFYLTADLRRFQGLSKANHANYPLTVTEPNRRVEQEPKWNFQSTQLMIGCMFGF